MIYIIYIIYITYIIHINDGSGKAEGLIKDRTDRKVKKGNRGVVKISLTALLPLYYV